jgi:WXXGXW repeat (2 copies)
MRAITIARWFSFPLLGLALLITAAPSLATAPAPIGIAVSITIPPPDLPVYDQPACPGDDYIWVPGYWAWDADNGGYYWVPGTWVLAPEPGFLWTPGYWSWGGASFLWIGGYWGPVVGFYGGVNYGFGYFGTGYVGGHWQNNHFYYNRAVTNVNVTVVHNVYNTRVGNVNVVNRVSYNGGRGGLTARPTPQQEAAARERHMGPVAAQRQQIRDARANRQLWASVNHGRPPIAATPRPDDFRGSGVMAAREAGTVHHAIAPAPATRVNPGRTSAPNTRENPENPRMNQQRANQEQQQQQAEQRHEQQIRSRPAEQPQRAERGQKPARAEQGEAQLQHETRAPAEKSAPEPKERKPEQR